MKIIKRNSDLDSDKAIHKSDVEQIIKADRWCGGFYTVLFSKWLKNTQSPISTDSIQQAMIRRGVRFPWSCRESMVKNLISLVGEYLSGCSAADRTTLRSNSLHLNTLHQNASAEQCFSFPIPKQATVARMEGLKDWDWRGIWKNSAKIREW